MTEAEKNEIVGLVMTEISSQAVDFDINTEQPQANDLLTAVRENGSGGYRGVTIKWDDVARIATELANQAATRAEQAETDANNILERVQSKGTEITNFVATSKTEIETQKNESVNAVKSVYQTDLNELKGDLDELRIKEIWNLSEKASVKYKKWVVNQWQTVGSKISIANEGRAFLVILDVTSIQGMGLHFVSERYANTYGSTGYNGKNSSEYICFSDENDNYISGKSYPQPTVNGYLVPDNAKYCYLTFMTVDTQSVSDDLSNLGYYWVTTRTENDHKNLLDLSDGVLTKQNVSTLTNEVSTLTNEVHELKGIQGNVQAIRKPTFSFIFDDGTNGDENVKSLFDSYGFKCGFALIADSALSTKKERYLLYQTDGYEILSHSTDGTVMGNSTDLTVEDVETKMKNSLSILTSNGFNVTGWVTPSTVLKNDFFQTLCKYYEYGFGHLSTNEYNIYNHNFFGFDIRQLDRWDLSGKTVEETIAKIDDTVSNNKYMVMYGHSYPETSGNMTVENMKTILDYLKSKVDSGEIIVDIPRNAINDFYKVRHSDLLELYNR